MEATALFAYEGPSDPQILSFNAGDVLIVIPIDSVWCRAKLRGKEGFAPTAYLDIKPHRWFMANITPEQTSTILLRKDHYKNYMLVDGAFIIRDSSKQPGNYSLSIKIKDAVQHFKIYYDFNDHKFKIWDDKFDSFNKLVEYHSVNSISKNDKILLRVINNTRYKVVTAYAGQSDDELTCKVGDTIIVSDVYDLDWFRGTLNNKEGRVPPECLKLME